MKIIYLHQYFCFPKESGGTRSYDLAKGFLNIGYDVEIVTSTSTKQKKRWTIVENDGLRIHYLYMPYDNSLTYIKRSLVFLGFLWFSAIKLMRLNADIVLATSTPLTIGIPALLKKWIHKTPFIFEVRDVWPEAIIAIGAVKSKFIQKLLYWLEKMIYKNAAAIVPLSVAMENSILSRYPNLNDTPIQVIENISEIKRFQNGFDSNRSIFKQKLGFIPRFTILYAGTFGRVNGINYVIELAAKLKGIDDTIIFLLIGSGAKEDDIRRDAKVQKVLNKNVFIWDSVSKDELPQLYYECSMGSSFVINIKELWANSANKFFDTLAAGRPILINHGGWQQKVIQENNIGYVLPANLSLSDIIQFVSYTKNVELIEKQKINALQVAKEKYSLDAALKKYKYIFDQINETNKYCLKPVNTF